MFTRELQVHCFIVELIELREKVHKTAATESNLSMFTQNYAPPPSWVFISPKSVGCCLYDALLRNG